MSIPSFLKPNDTFIHRHIAPSEAEQQLMLDRIGSDSLDALVSETVPAGIRMKSALALGEARGEHELVQELSATAKKNRVFRSYIGMGYHGTIVPPVILRNILENPGWYTQYTPYQAEISQGRLEALLVFQTMVSDMTALPLAGASLLDEATAAAEAMNMCYAIGRGKCSSFFVSERCHPQTIAVVQTRARASGIEVIIGDHEAFDFAAAPVCGALVQYPETEGRVLDYDAFAERAHAAGARVVVAADLLALAMLRAPGEFGADIAIGSTQRFGVPMGYGGPHAAYLATKDEFKRQMPGRMIGVSRDVNGAPALRMAMQTREQHIRRDKATSNICTAQVLLAIMSGMYAVYHGPNGIRAIAERVHGMTELLASGARALGLDVANGPYFDTLRIEMGAATGDVNARAGDREINLRPLGDGAVGISLDETVTLDDVRDLLWVLAGDAASNADVDTLAQKIEPEFAAPYARTSEYLQLRELPSAITPSTRCCATCIASSHATLSLTTSMIPLGSCTMKLNAHFGDAAGHVAGVRRAASLRSRGTSGRIRRALFESLEGMLAEITGFSAVSLQPNAGSQGEYTGLLVIRAYHGAAGNQDRNICLIPVSAHGTNPASAVMVGMKVVAVACDENGNIDVADLEAKAEKHSANLAALMVTYPSTHGVFEEEIARICDIVHEHGGQVYLDGANMNAQVGLCRPGDFGADVCHLNLHKTFCIPHGGGGPGMGPIGVAKHLAPFLPGHPVPSRPAGPTERVRWLQRPGEARASSRSRGSTSR